MRVVVFVFDVFSKSTINGAFCRKRMFRCFLFSVGLMRRATLPLSLVGPLRRVSVFPVSSVTVSFKVSFGRDATASKGLGTVDFLGTGQVFNSIGVA